jgi:DNA-binding CsgD family transcriptional regulator
MSGARNVCAICTAEDDIPIRDQQLGPVLEHIAAPSFAADARGTFKWLNAAAIELLGDVRGRRVTLAVAPHDQGKLRKAFARWLTGTSSDLEAMLITGNGTLAPSTLSATALFRDNYVVGVFGIVTCVPTFRTQLQPPIEPERLSPRQFEVLQLLATGATTQEMAGSMHLSTETVRNHVSAVLRKLKAKSRLEAVAIAHRNSLIVHWRTADGYGGIQ